MSSLGAGDLLFNIGACVGSYALIAAARGARVVCVEASPVNAARLAENVAANNLGHLVTVVLAVCGPTEQPMSVGLGSATAGAADVRIGGDGVQLPGVTLDGLADVHGYPTALLVDVDGGELDVLRGGTETLARLGSAMLEVSRESRIVKGCDALLIGGGLRPDSEWTERNGVTIEGVFYAEYRRPAA